MCFIFSLCLVSILADTVKRNKSHQSMLIYWNEDNICRMSNRDFHDNVANVFLPQLMKIKESLMYLEGDLDAETTWIKASLCDGEDEKSEQLIKALEDKNSDEKIHRKVLQIRASVENVVHSLHRVEAMRARLPQIFAPSNYEDEETHL